MDNRTCVDRQTYLRILANQRDYYERLAKLATTTGERPIDADTLARQAIAAAFVCSEDLSDEAFQKDHDDARREDWTTA